MQFKALEKIGLTAQQEEIYLELLKQGPSTVGSLIKRMKIGRVSCYDTLNRLINKGLASFVKTRGQRLYQATNPQLLLKIAEEKETKATREKKEIQQIVPELEKLKRASKETEEEATTYKTKEGMKALFELMLKEGKTIYVMSATGKALQEMKYYFPEWQRQRVKKNIPVKVIFNKELKKKEATKMPLAEVRYLPKEQSNPATVFIFDSYTATLHWQDTPFAFVIKSEAIAKSYLKYFEILWNIARK